MTLADHIEEPMEVSTLGVSFDTDGETMTIGAAGVRTLDYTMSVYAETGIAGGSANPDVTEDEPTTVASGSLPNFQNQDAFHGNMMRIQTDIRFFAQWYSEAFTPGLAPNQGTTIAANGLFENAVNVVNLDISYNGAWRTTATVSQRTSAPSHSVGLWTANYPTWAWVEDVVDKTVSWRVRVMRWSAGALNSLSWSAWNLYIYGFPADEILSGDA